MIGFDPTVQAQPTSKLRVVGGLGRPTLSEPTIPVSVKASAILISGRSQVVGRWEEDRLLIDTEFLHLIEQCFIVDLQ